METAVLYAIHKMHLINFNQLQTAFDPSVIIECITKKERAREKSSTAMNTARMLQWNYNL